MIKKKTSAVKKSASKAPKKPIKKTVNQPKTTERLAKNYIPTESERYMSKKQLLYFRSLFEKMRSDITNAAERLIDTMRDEIESTPDDNDRASKESEFSVALRGRDRERRLLQKIDSALIRIEKKEFGICEECGVEIGIARLLARPVATLCIECKNLQEEFEKSGGIVIDSGSDLL